MRSLLFILFVISAGLAACKKDKSDTDAFWNCNQSQSLDSTAVASKLLGSWIWAKQACYWDGGKSKKADKNIQVTFQADHTFSEAENGTIRTQGTWKIIPQDGVPPGASIYHRPADTCSATIRYCSMAVT